MGNADFGKMARDYRKHRAGFPAAFFERAAALGIGLPGQHLLDMGTGTGSLARKFAQQGCNVTALDSAMTMLEQAALLDELAGVNIKYCVADAEDTGLSSARFDVITAGQCWHRFKRGQAAGEACRLLKEGGILAISHFDCLSCPGNIVEATESLIKRHNPGWAMGGSSGIYPQWFKDLSDAGFCRIESLSFDVDVVYSHEDWRGRVRACAGITAGMGTERAALLDQELEACLMRDFPEALLVIPHRVFLVWGKKPANA